MSNAQQDTEITLGTGRMLALFFGLVLVCAVFFAVGFSLGRKVGTAGAGSPLAQQAQTPATVVRPTAGKNNSLPAPSSEQFGFYKAVGQKNADAPGRFVTYPVNNVSGDMSFLEMLDVLNEELTGRAVAPEFGSQIRGAPLLWMPSRGPRAAGGLPGFSDAHTVLSTATGKSASS